MDTIDILVVGVVMISMLYFLHFIGLIDLNEPVNNSTTIIHCNCCSNYHNFIESEVLYENKNI